MSSDIKPGRALPWREVLVRGEKNRATVKRAYRRRLKELGLQERCAEPTCWFHTRPLCWNRKELEPILDHVNGDSHNNLPSNLRLLCPNCDAQNEETKGGANRGRILERLPGGSKIKNKKTGGEVHEATMTPAKLKLRGSTVKSK